MKILEIKDKNCLKQPTPSSAPSARLCAMKLMACQSFQASYIATVRSTNYTGNPN